MLSEQDWFVFGSGGGPAIVEICTLPRELVSALGAATNKLLCNQHYMKKIRFKHRVAAHNLWIIDQALEHGMILRCGDSNLSFITFYERHAKYYEAIIKVTRERHEIWLSTFHRVKPREVRRKMRLFRAVPRQ